jgi:hypothetical protein
MPNVKPSMLVVFDWKAGLTELPNYRLKQNFQDLRENKKPTKPRTPYPR